MKFSTLEALGHVAHHLRRVREIMGRRGFLLDLEHHLALRFVIPSQGGWIPTIGRLHTTGLNLSHKLSFALSWGTLPKGGSPWHTNTRDPVPMPSFGTARRSRSPRWQRW